MFCGNIIWYIEYVTVFAFHAFVFQSCLMETVHALPVIFHSSASSSILCFSST